MSEGFFCAIGRNQSWQVWVSLRGKTMMAESKMAKFKMAEFKMAAFIKLSENEWVWVRLNYFESESEWSESVFEWIWEKKTRCLNPNMAEFKMTAIIKLSQNKWVRVFFVQMVGTNLGKCEWVWQEKLRWLNPRWPNSRWLPSSNWVRMNEFESDWISLSQSFVQNGWIQDGRIQDGRIQDGCHHQVKQIELVWVRVRVEGECFGVNLREDKKVSESNMAEFKMAAIIKLSQNEWVKFS